ncbi:NUDIX domain-containing protein [Naumannella halotolerans]|uniref:NUDIX hydrolase n=1 Tax=Naumannella halotolerans TaxID=993414 RepID=UPI00370D1D6F
MVSSRDVLARIPQPRFPIPRSTTGSVPPQAAATVMVVRPVAEADRELQVWLMQRHARMAFAPNMAVFPGGKLDPIDRRAPDPLRACAVRELAEETTLVLDPERLVPWARWITPAIEPRRYDTWFYLAVVPSGTHLRDVSGEADDAFWITPAEALARSEARTLALMPPTLAGLLELSDHDSTESLLQAAAQRVVEPIRPVFVADGEQGRLEYPPVPADDPEYAVPLSTESVTGVEPSTPGEDHHVGSPVPRPGDPRRVGP